MKSFKQWLIEASMDLSTAMSIFGLAQPPKSSEELKSLYKKLAMRCHPDHGGSTQKMQELNAARDVLMRNIGAGGSRSSRSRSETEERIRKLREFEKMVVASVAKFFTGFKKDAYKEYFEGIFKKPFDVKVKTGKDKSMFSTEDIPYLEMTACTEGNADVFNLRLTANVRDSAFNLLKGTSLASKDVVFDYYVTTDALTGGKKQVIVKSLHVKKSDPAVLSNPETVFPKARMVKLASGTVRKNSTLKKRDFEAVFINKWNCEKSSDTTWVFPYEKTKDGIERCFGIGRVVLMRKGFYNVCANFCERDNSNQFAYWKSIKDGIKIDCKFLPECAETMKFFEDLFAYAKKTLDRKKIAEYVKKKSVEVVNKTMD